MTKKFSYEPRESTVNKNLSKADFNLVHMGDDTLSYFIGKTDGQSFGLKPSLKMQKNEMFCEKKLYFSK